MRTQADLEAAIALSKVTAMEEAGKNPQATPFGGGGGGGVKDDRPWWEVCDSVIVRV